MMSCILASLSVGFNPRLRTSDNFAKLPATSLKPHLIFLDSLAIMKRRFSRQSEQQQQQQQKPRVFPTGLIELSNPPDSIIE